MWFNYAMKKAYLDQKFMNGYREAIMHHKNVIIKIIILINLKDQFVKIFCTH